MKFRVESGDLSLDVISKGYHESAIKTLTVWHTASERIHLCAVLTSTRIGPRGGLLADKMFSTVSLLNELGLKFISLDSGVITMQTAKPKILSIEDVAAGRWIALRKIHYQWPGEAARSWDYVTRPTKKGKIDAVVVVPFLKSPNRLVVIGEFRVPINDYEIGFPAGLLDGDETPEEAARREMKEETGLTLTKVLTVSPPLFTSAGMTDENVVMVICECEGELNGVQSAEERIEVFALDLNGVESILKDPPCSVGARAWPFLQMMKAQGCVEWKQK